MSRILVFAETDGARLLPQTGAAITFAQQTGIPFDILALGHNVDVSAASGFGAERILVADDPRLAKPLADRCAAMAARSDYSHIVCASTTFGRDVLPRAAALLGATMLSDVMSIVDFPSGVFTRPMYAGAAIATVKASSSPLCVSVRTTSFGKPEARGGGTTEPVVIPDLPTGAEWESAQTSASARPDLTQARVVVSGGRPMRDAETFEKYIGGLADKLGGAVGATRAAVDAGIVGNDLQVGQTGKIVAPDLYIAAGISGSTQHLAGMGSSKVIVAINKDPDAPIFEIADYGIVADLYEVIPEMLSKL